jgi:hypothetical protein
MVTKKIPLMIASECRAKAASLRTISAYAHNPASKARMLEMALKWDAHAESCDIKRIG